MSLSASVTPPRTALILKIDTLGDLVVFAPVLQRLREAWPQTRLVALIRQSYLDLAPLLAPGVEWLATTLDPFTQEPEADPAEVKRLRDAAIALQPEVVAAATSRRTWLEVAIAAATPQARRIALGASADDEFFATRLRVVLGLEAADVFAEQIPRPPDEPDWRSNQRLADALLGRAAERIRPSVTLDGPTRATAADFLAAHNLHPGRYVVCAAAGFANVRLKTWPADRFAAALKHLHAHHGLPTLLVGHESERDYLEPLLAHLSASTPPRPSVSPSLAPSVSPSLPPSVPPSVAPSAALWLGREGSLPQLAALVAESALFFGNDTGAMHLAAAVDVPVVAVFGGGTWPRFIPAARRGAAVVHPLPCFGCGWDCAFGDAPCLGEISVADARLALDHALGVENAFRVIEVQHLSAETRAFMGKAAARYREMQADHLARQHKLEELTALAREKDAALGAQETVLAERAAALIEKEKSLLEKDAALVALDKDLVTKDAEIVAKDAEIASLKNVCDEREKALIAIDGHLRAFQNEANLLRADKAVLEKTLAALPADAARAAQQIGDQIVHIRNLEALLGHRESELAEMKISAANFAGGLHDLEQAKQYGRLLAAKEAVIRSLHQGVIERDALIARLAAGTSGAGAALHTWWRLACAFVREKWRRPFDAWLFRRVVEGYWMQIGILRHYAPRPLKWDERLPGPRRPDAALPQIAVVTPSYGQEKFIERALRSVLDQLYPRLVYVVQDGGSKDRSPEIVAQYADRLRHWESARDRGQADAICRGFAHITASLGPNDIMAWLNSDDLIAPGSLRFVAEYFAAHLEVDAVYGHRIIIDDDDRDVGRWIMPRHDPRTLEWIDYVPQETLFWRKRAWDLVGGIDPSFHFALDWDLLARFQQAGCRIVRVPYFLGAFRVHTQQKTSQAIHTTGADEMRRIRTRFHGEKQDNFATIDRYARHTRFRGALTARLHEIGVRW